jgi:hypothetical protein
LHAKSARDVRSCRFCNTELRHIFVELGMSHLCETYLDSEQLDLPERFFPLRPLVCHECFLVQLDEYVALEEIFDDRYTYYASYSDTFVARGVPVLGVDPAANVAATAAERGIPTLTPTRTTA